MKRIAIQDNELTWDKNELLKAFIGLVAIEKNVNRAAGKK